jgi:hypothetical protein
VSAEAAGWVFRHSPFTGATFACHISIGDSVNDQYHNEFFMSVANLAIKARVERRSAGRAVAELEEAGFIQCLEPDGVDLRRLGRPVRYLFLFPSVPVVYESRSTAGGATPRRTPQVRHHVAPPATPDRTGVRQEAAGGATPGRTIPIEPNGDPKGNPSPSSSPPDGATEELSKTAAASPHLNDARRLCDLLAELMDTNGFKPAAVITKTWIEDMEKLMRVDGRTPTQVENAIRWAQADAFWAPNVRSPRKLRQQYDTLRARAYG